jgi:hypothetical protein
VESQQNKGIEKRPEEALTKTILSFYYGLEMDSPEQPD